jgi:hypothetical protein
MSWLVAYRDGSGPVMEQPTNSKKNLFLQFDLKPRLNNQNVFGFFFFCKNENELGGVRAPTPFAGEYVASKCVLATNVSIHSPFTIISRYGFSQSEIS